MAIRVVSVASINLVLAWAIYPSYWVALHSNANQKKASRLIPERSWLLSSDWLSRRTLDLLHYIFFVYDHFLRYSADNSRTTPKCVIHRGLKELARINNC